MDFDRESLLNEGFDGQDGLIEIVEHEVSSIRRRLNEIKGQIDNMRGSVEREQGKYSNIASELHNIRQNLDTVPREDIRDKFDEALEVRFRLLTMQGQLEKFEEKHETLKDVQTLLDKILTGIRGYEASEDDNDNMTQGNFDIIGIIRAQEDERQRMARSLHDGPAQSLTNFILQAEICRRLFDRNPDRAGAELDDLKNNASRTFQKIRDYIFELRPMMLEDLGVVPTVRRYVDTYKDKSDIEVKFILKGEERRLENFREVLLFRGIQNIMSGARDYAVPSQIEVTLDLQESVARVTIHDNGRGFNSENWYQRTQEEGYSDARVETIAMLRNRLELVGGHVEVESSEKGGTIVHFELPTGE